MNHMASGRDPSEVAEIYRRKLGLPDRVTFQSLSECASGSVHIENDKGGTEYGRFDVVGGRPHIRVHHGSPSRSAVYTLAHELGHYLYRAGSLQSPDEEQWCHEFAENLTMPAGMIRREAVDSVSASVVAEMARVWGVGILDAASRVCRLLGWQVALIWFDPEKAAVSPAISGSYGVPASLKYRIVIGSGWDASEDGRPTFAKIRIDTSDDFVPATFAVTDGGCVLAAILSDDLRCLELRHRPMPRDRIRHWPTVGTAPVAVTNAAEAWWRASVSGSGAGRDQASDIDRSS